MNEVAIQNPLGVDAQDPAASKQGLKMLAMELTLQRRHFQLLREQNTALIICDRRRFALLHEQYAALTGELEIQFKLRSVLFGSQRIDKIVAQWPEADRRFALKIAGELRTVVLESRRVGEQNRKLVANQMKYVDFMLKILINTHRKGSMYGPQGLQSINRGNILFNSAA